MRIAVTYENGMVFQHFGHSAQFKIYDAADGEIIKAEVVGANGSGHGALAALLADWKVDALICGGIGGGAQQALANAGIKLYGGVAGQADDAVRALLSGTLSWQASPRCGHHGDHGDCGGHRCSGSCH